MYLSADSLPYDLNDLKSKVRNELMQRVWVDQISKPNAPIKRLPQQLKAFQAGSEFLIEKEIVC